MKAVRPQIKSLNNQVVHHQKEDISIWKKKLGRQGIKTFHISKLL